MTLSHYETSPLIESLSGEQGEQFAKIGESIVKVSLAHQNIDNLQRIIARESSYLYQFKPGYGEALKPEPDKLFAVVLTEPVEFTIYSPYMVDNGCRSGISSNKYIYTPQIREDKPTVFLAASVTPYAYDYHGELLNGYQFNAPGHMGLNLVLEPNIQQGTVDGVELGQVDYFQAAKLLEGQAIMAGMSEEAVARQRETVNDLIAGQEAQMSLKLES